MSSLSSPPPLPPVNPYAPPTNLADTPPQASSPLIDSVMAGGRFITVPYVISVVVLSFKRSMGSVHYVSQGAWPMGEVFSATLITCLLGWWGFPFGLIWTFISLFHLWRGGRDVTGEILTREVGGQEARRILSMAPKPAPPRTIWLVRLIILVPVLVLVGLWLALMYDTK